MPAYEPFILFTFRLIPNIIVVVVIIAKMLIILHLKKKKHQTIHFVTATITWHSFFYFVVFIHFQTTDYRNTIETTYTISFCRNDFAFYLCIYVINFIIRFCSFIFIITCIVLTIYIKLVLIIWVWREISSLFLLFSCSILSVC